MTRPSAIPPSPSRGLREPRATGATKTPAKSSRGQGKSATAPRRRAAPQNGRAGRGVTLATLLGLVVLIGLAVLLLRPLLLGSGATGDQAARSVAFHVRLGDTVAVVADRLQVAGVLDNGISGTLFKVDARVQGLAGHLRAGTYTLSTGMSPTAAVDALSSAPVPISFSTVTVVIPEGWRLEQVAHLLATKGLVDETQFLSLARYGQFSNDFLHDRPPGATLEGYLFPDTYNVATAIGTRGMIQTMLDEFGRQFTLPLRRTAWAHGQSIYAIVTMASIVEREAIYPQERPLIAGVYYNRVAGHEGGYLNADPTVQYAVGAATYASPEHRWWTAHLTHEQLATDSPYNTYLYRGLPPGPIANPGLASLQAAVHPTATDYNYFFAPPGGGGHSIFCKTLACQNAAVGSG